LTEAQAWPIRKDILSSPQSLIMLGGLAQAQGKMDEFLKSLEAVKTSWGTFDFRKAFELGQATGDWSALNDEFSKAFGVSKELSRIMPDWKDKLLIVGDAADTVAESVGRMAQKARTATDETSRDIATMSKSVSADLGRTGDTIGKESERIVNDLRGIATGSKSIIDDMSDRIVDTTRKTSDSLRDIVTRSTASLREIVHGTVSTMAEVNDRISEYISNWRVIYDRDWNVDRMPGPTQPRTPPPGSDPPPGRGFIPRADTGGYVERSGVAIIHKGETITPASQAASKITIAPTFIINAIDGADAARVTKEKIFPALLKMLENNARGSRTRLKRRLSLAT